MELHLSSIWWEVLSVKCPYCQANNLEGAEFCGKCGKPFRVEKVCPQYGAENPPEAKFCEECGHPLVEQAPSPKPLLTQPASFAGGRYQVKKFLGEGGKKKVYLAHNNVLDGDVAFALIKTEKLVEVDRTRIKREARAIEKLGDHEGQPYIVIPFMAGGDIERLIEKAPEYVCPWIRL
jgi:ribosomal protein L40E